MARNRFISVVSTRLSKSSMTLRTESSTLIVLANVKLGPMIKKVSQFFFLSLSFDRVQGEKGNLSVLRTSTYFLICSPRGRKADSLKNIPRPCCHARQINVLPSFILSCTLSLAVDFSAWPLITAQTNVSTTPITAL